MRKILQALDIGNGLGQDAKISDFSQQHTFEKPASRWGVLIACIASVMMLGGLLWGGLYCANSDGRIASDPRIFRLTEQDFETKVAFGKSPLCGAGSSECWLDQNFDDASWLRIKLPHYDIRLHPEFSRGVKEGAIYYRMRIKVPKALLAEGEEISFSPRYIHHGDFSVFVGKQLILRSGANTARGMVVNIPIPKDAIEHGEVQLSIKASLDVSDVGMMHRSHIYMGPRLALDRYYAASEMEHFTFYLLFLLAKTSVFIVLSCFYAFSAHTRGLGSFLIFAACSILCELLQGRLLAGFMDLGWRSCLFFSCRVISVCALASFLLSWMGVKIPRRLALGFSLLAFSATWLAAYDFAWGSRHVTIAGLFAATKAFYVVMIAVCVVWGWRVKPPRERTLGKPKLLTFLTTYVVIYLAALIWDFYLRTAIFGMLPFIEICLFYALVVELIRGHAVDAQLLQIQEEELSVKRVNSAIAQTAMMMAHDVRSPLASLQMMIESMASLEDATQIRAVKDAVLPNIKRRLNLVHDMVADILEVSGPSTIKKAPCSLKSLLRLVFDDVLGLKNTDELTIAYSFGHSSQVLIDDLKIQRVFTNIIANAIDAMEGRGKMWVKTRDFQDSDCDRVEIVIGNDGPAIPPDSLLKIFEVFYTKGKSNGTGLGLAIARKIIHGHGGQIWCTSSEQGGTEFIMSLPADAKLVDQSSADLPIQAGALQIRTLLF